MEKNLIAVETEMVKSDLVNLSNELIERQTDIVKGLSRFLDVWVEATKEQIFEEDLNFMQIMEEKTKRGKEFTVLSSTDNEPIGNFCIFFKRGTMQITKKITWWKTRATVNRVCSFDELEKNCLIEISQNLKYSLECYLSLLKRKQGEYDQLKNILNKF